MNIVLGASGQVGSMIVHNLLAAKAPVRAVVHSEGKGDDLRQRGAQVTVADSFDADALRQAFQGGSTAFVLTPDSGKSNDAIGDIKTMLANYRAAVENSSVTKVVGLSSMGAQFPVGTLELSYLLERAFTGLDVQTVFVRPAYFYSNWLMFLPAVKESNVLPTFYPEDLKIPMLAPSDVAAFVADRMREDVDGSPIYELEGPQWYSSSDVATALGQVLGRNVTAKQTPRAQWGDALRQAGFTEDAVKNFLPMTEMVADGKSGPEGNGTIQAKTDTTLEQYLSKHVER